MVRPQCRGCGFDPWLGNEDPTCHMVWPKGKEKLREKKKKKDKSFLDSEKHSCNCNTSCFLPHSLPHCVNFPDWFHGSGNYKSEVNVLAGPFSL